MEKNVQKIAIFSLETILKSWFYIDFKAKSSLKCTIMKGEAAVNKVLNKDWYDYGARIHNLNDY